RHVAETGRQSLNATRMIDPRDGNVFGQQALDTAPRVDACLRCRRAAGAREHRVEMRIVKARVVEGSARLTALEQRREKGERGGGGNAGAERVEAFWRRACRRQKGSELGLLDLRCDAARGEVGLHELLEGVVATADGREVEGERLAVATARSAV